MGGWLPPSRYLVRCCPRRHSANPLEVIHLVIFLLVKPYHIVSRTSPLLWGVLCRQVRLGALLGVEVGWLLLRRIQGMAGVGLGLVLGVALVLRLKFPGQRLAPRSSPRPYPPIPWWRLATGYALPAT